MGINQRHWMDRLARAFGLIEMLEVIGVLAAITIPYFGKLQAGAEREKDRMNAQNIAALSGAISALGIAHVLPDSLGASKPPPGCFVKA